VRSADRSISSAVQKDATCCLYMDHRSACSRGKREKRDPQSSVRQIGSMNGNSSSVGGSVFVRITGWGGCVCWGGGVCVDVLPPRGELRLLLLASFFAFDSDGASTVRLSSSLSGRAAPPRSSFNL